VNQANDLIYAIDGRTSSSPFSQNVYEYDPIGDSWTQKSSIPNVYFLMRSTVINDTIYVVGDVSGILRVERYAASSDSWTTMTATTTTRGDFYSVASANGKIYVFGGRAGAFLDIVEEYDPVSDSWSTKTPMPTPRAGTAAVTYNNKIYIVGGLYHDGQVNNVIANVVEVYDPVADSWTTKPTLPTARRNLEVQVLEDKLFAFGGHDGTTESNVTEEFNLLREVWLPSDSMATGRESFGSGVANNRIYGVGGQSATILASNEEFRGAIPLSPAGFIAVAGDRRVDLQWNKNSEPDIFEYVVYRSLVDRVLVFLDSLGRPSSSDTVFVDSTVVNHKTYFYRVAAVDTNFNRSDFSLQGQCVPT
jgi:hypothetical protein